MTSSTVVKDCNPVASSSSSNINYGGGGSGLLFNMADSMEEDLQKPVAVVVLFL